MAPVAPLGRRGRALVRPLLRVMMQPLRRSPPARARVSHVEGMGLRREPVVDIAAVLPPRVLLAAAVAVATAAWLA